MFEVGKCYQKKDCAHWPIGRVRAIDGAWAMMQVWIGSENRWGEDRGIWKWGDLTEIPDPSQPQPATELQEWPLVEYDGRLLVTMPEGNLLPSYSRPVGYEGFRFDLPDGSIRDADALVTFWDDCGWIYARNPLNHERAITARCMLVRR